VRYEGATIGKDHISNKRCRRNIDTQIGIRRTAGCNNREKIGIYLYVIKCKVKWGRIIR
jgi:hypothetical protein